MQFFGPCSSHRPPANVVVNNEYFENYIKLTSMRSFQDEVKFLMFFTETIRQRGSEQWVTHFKNLNFKVCELCASYDELIKVAQERAATLQGKALIHDLQQDLKEMDHWIHTKLQILDRWEKIIVKMTSY